MIDIDRQINPRIFICRIGWMSEYRGEAKIEHGGKFITDNKFGYEIYNFLPYKGKMYGYVQPPARKNLWFKSQIQIDKLGASASHDSVDGVLVVWVAQKDMTTGMRVVGWYKNAKVHRGIHKIFDSKRIYPDGSAPVYRIEAKEEDCFLVPEEDRINSPKIPKSNSKQQLSGMGESNILYLKPEHESLVQKLIAFINKYETMK